MSTWAWIALCAGLVIGQYSFDKWIMRKYRHGTGPFWDEIRAKVNSGRRQ